MKSLLTSLVYLGNIGKGKGNTDNKYGPCKTGPLLLCICVVGVQLVDLNALCSETDKNRTKLNYGIGDRASCFRSSGRVAEEQMVETPSKMGGAITSRVA